MPLSGGPAARSRAGGCVSVNPPSCPAPAIMFTAATHRLRAKDARVRGDLLRLTSGVM